MAHGRGRHEFLSGRQWRRWRCRHRRLRTRFLALEPDNRRRGQLGQPSVISLGEGMTPLIRTKRPGQVWVKDEGLNPTGSFKARGLSCAVSMAVELGIRKLAIPSAGNAASAMAAYAAAAGLEAHIFMPRDVPQANYIECQAFGAKVTLVDGLISECVRLVNEGCAAEGWFDVSTL